MSNLFQSIVDSSLFSEWAKVLDWLFDDDKFNPQKGWTSGYVGVLSKKIKKMQNFRDGNTYQYGTIKSLHFPENRCTSVMVQFSNGNSECKDFVRHIRNGIAHGNTLCFKNKNILYIEIKDYDTAGKKQTAYMCFPLTYIADVYKLYCEVKKSYGKNKKKSTALHKEGKK